MSQRSWIPKIIRRKSDRKFHLSYQVSGAVPPSDPNQRVATVCAANGISVTGSGDNRWDILLHGNTRVFGFVSREVEEEACIHLEPWADGLGITVSCEPTETQAAHAVGAVGVLVFATLAWIASGLADGALAAVAVIVAGWLVVEVTRHWAYDAFEGRICGLTEALGRSFWPKRPGQIVRPDTY